MPCVDDVLEKLTVNQKPLKARAVENSTALIR